MQAVQRWQKLEDQSPAAAAADKLGQITRERDDSTDSVFEPVKLLPNPRRTQRMPDRPLNGYLFITALHSLALA